MNEFTYRIRCDGGGCTSIVEVTLDYEPGNHSPIQEIAASEGWGRFQARRIDTSADTEGHLCPNCFAKLVAVTASAWLPNPKVSK